MTLGRLIRLRGWVAYGLAVVYALAGGAGLLWADFDETSSRAVWVVLLWGGAALMVACILFVHAASWPAAALISLGAIAGGLALFWTIVIPLVVAAIIAMSFAIARAAPEPA